MITKLWYKLPKTIRNILRLILLINILVVLIIIFCVVMAFITSKLFNLSESDATNSYSLFIGMSYLFGITTGVAIVVGLFFESFTDIYPNLK